MAEDPWAQFRFQEEEEDPWAQFRIPAEPEAPAPSGRNGLEGLMQQAPQDLRDLGTMEQMGVSAERGFRRTGNAARLLNLRRSANISQGMEELYSLYETAKEGDDEEKKRNFARMRKLADQYSTDSRGMRNPTYYDRYHRFISDLEEGLDKDARERMDKAKKDSTNRMVEFLAEASEISKLPRDADLEEAVQEGFGKTVAALIKEPSRLLNVLAESSPGLVAAAAGAVVGGPVGSGFGIFLNEGLVRLQEEVVREMDKRGLDPSKPEDLEKVINDRDLMRIVSGRAIRAAGSVALTEGVIGGLAGRTGGLLSRVGKTVAAGSVAGAAGEILAGQAAEPGREVEGGEVALEAIAGISEVAPAVLSGGERKPSARMERHLDEMDEAIEEAVHPDSSIEDVIDAVEDVSQAPEAEVEAVPEVDAEQPEVTLGDEDVKDIEAEIEIDAAERAFEAEITEGDEDGSTDADASVQRDRVADEETAAGAGDDGTTGTERGGTDEGVGGTVTAETPDAAGTERERGQVPEVRGGAQRPESREDGSAPEVQGRATDVPGREGERDDDAGNQERHDSGQTPVQRAGTEGQADDAGSGRRGGQAADTSTGTDVDVTDAGADEPTSGPASASGTADTGDQATGPESTVVAGADEQPVPSSGAAEPLPGRRRAAGPAVADAGGDAGAGVEPGGVGPTGGDATSPAPAGAADAGVQPTVQPAPTGDIAADGASVTEETTDAQGVREDAGPLPGRRVVGGGGAREGGPDMEQPQPRQPGGARAPQPQAKERKSAVVNGKRVRRRKNETADQFEARVRETAAEGVKDYVRNKGKPKKSTSKKRVESPVGELPKHDENGLARTRTVREEDAQYARNLLDMMGFKDVKLTVASKKDILDDVGKAPFLWDTAIIDHALEPAGKGIMSINAGRDDVIISVDTTHSFAKPIAYAHEVGHVVEKRMLRDADPKTKKALMDAWEREITDTLLRNQTNAYAAYRETLPEGIRQEMLDDGELDVLKVISTTQLMDESFGKYVFSFSEWMAHGVAKWAMTEAKPRSLVDKFFSNVAQKIKMLYQAATGKAKLPAPELKKYLDGLVESARQDTSLRSFTEGMTAEMGDRVEARLRNSGPDGAIRRIYWSLSPENRRLFDDLVNRYAGVGLTQAQANRMKAKENAKIDQKVKDNKISKSQGETLKNDYAKKVDARIGKSLVRLEADRLIAKNRKKTADQLRNKEITRAEKVAADAKFLKDIEADVARADRFGIAEDYVAGYFARKMIYLPDTTRMRGELISAASRSFDRGDKGFQRDYIPIGEARKMADRWETHEKTNGGTQEEILEEARKEYDKSGDAKLRPSLSTNTAGSMQPGDGVMNWVKAVFSTVPERREAAAKAAEDFVRRTQVLKWMTTDPLKNLIDPELFQTSLSLVRGAKTRALHVARNMLDMGEMKTLNKPRDVSKKEWNKRKDGVRSLVWEYMTDKGASVERIVTDAEVAKAMKMAPGDPELKKAAADLRELAFDTKTRMLEAGLELVKQGILTEEQFRKYGGAYLPRMYIQWLRDKPESSILLNMTNRPSPMDYKKHRNEDLSPWYRDMQLQEIKDPAFQASRAFGVQMSDAALINWMGWLSSVGGERNWLMPNSTARYRGMTVTPEWLYAQADSVDERIKKGHYGGGIKRDAAIDMIKEMRDLADATVKARGFDLAANQEGTTVRRKDLIVQPKEAQGDKQQYIQIPNSARYGALRGLAVHESIYDQIVSPWAMGGVAGTDVMQALTKFQAMWKLAKVPLNFPVSHIRNLVSGALHMTMGGVSLTAILRDLPAMSQEFRKQSGKWYELAEKHGISQSTFTENEMMNIDSSFKVLARMLEKPTAKQRVLNLGEKAMMSWPIQGSLHLYQGIEVVQKMVMMKYGMEKLGMDEYRAVRYANDNIFDYGMVGKNIEIIRRIPIGSPFATYTFKVLPMLAHNMIRNPIRTSLTVMVLPHLLASWALGSLDDEDLDDFAEGMPRWMKEKIQTPYGLPPTGMILPIKDDNGNVQFFDFGYFMPPASFIDIAKWGVEGVESIFGDRRWERGLLEPALTLGFGSTPLLSGSSYIQTGLDAFTGREISSKNWPVDEQIGASMAHWWNFFVPSSIATYGGLGRAIKQNAFGIHDPMSGPEYTTGQLLARTFGMNVRPIDMDIELMKRGWDVQRTSEEASRRAGMKMRSGAATADELDDQFDATRWKIKNLEKAMKGRDAMRRAGF